MNDFVVFLYVTSMLVTAVITTIGTSRGEVIVKKKYPEMGDKAVLRLIIISNFISVFMPIYNTGMAIYATSLLLKTFIKRK